MKPNLQELKKEAIKEIDSVKTAKELEAVRIRYLGRKEGILTKILRSLKHLTLEEKKKLGPAANIARKEIEELLSKKLKELQAASARPLLDITMPGKKVPFGHLHPLTLIQNEIREIFRSLNFSVIEGPEAETEYYNFDALNIPHDHPARDMWDTFWLKEPKSILLRTHTSPMQIRYMEKHNPPFQIIVPGRVFRYEATDASHEINFHQVEGLMVGENVSLANFKYIIQQFFRQLFGPHADIRLRPSYFPFVEPGLEVDVKLNNKWLEVMGAGMVHPRVFEAAGYNPKNLQGFAFGLGVERLAMIKYNIPDIRLFYSGDLRFIKQF